MNVARHSKRLLAALMASTLTVVDVHAAVTDIFSQPLATTSTVVAKPNIMRSSWTTRAVWPAPTCPDDMSDTGKYGYKSPSMQWPRRSIRTTPHIAADQAPDGTSYADASASPTR